MTILDKIADRVAEHPPPGPFRRRSWRSPLRGPWLTSVLGLTLLVGLLVVIVTGLLSYASYNPNLAGNDPTVHRGLLGFYLFSWPTHPVWLYRLTQSLHVTLGLVLVPVVLAKLWSVIPRLFAWPPMRTVAQVVERVSLLMLVGGIVFEMVTGILNIQLFYAFPFSFYTAHLFGAWVFIAGFVVHVAVKLPKALRSVRRRRLRDELRTPLARTAPEEREADQADSLVPDSPAPPTMSRRGALAFVGAGSLALLAVTVGQDVDPLRRTALLAPHGHTYPDGPNGFQVNKTAKFRGISSAKAGDSWSLQLRGARTLTLTRADLLALDQRTYRLPIACVEGWSTEQVWTGVPLRDLAAKVGMAPAEVFVESLQKAGSFGSVRLSSGQVADGRTLLALKVNGADLSLDHGFPARVIVPAGPGVHNTKWVRRLTFGAGS